MELEVSREVDAAPEALWGCVVDVTRWPALTPSIDEVRWIEGREVAVGSRARVRQPALGSNVWEVTDVHPATSFAWRASRPGVTTDGTHRVERLAGGRSRLTLGLHERGPLAPLLALLIGGRARRYVEQEADGMKRGAEAG